jgi:hypothetical protein
VNYIEGFKYSTDLVIKGLSKEPIAVSGTGKHIALLYCIIAI